MAKLNALELLNEVLRNIGSDTVSDLTSLTGEKLRAFNALNEVILDIGTGDKWRPLERTATITLSSNTNTYTQSSDMVFFDKDSFRYNEAKKIFYKTPQQYDREYVTQTDTGSPSVISDYGGYWHIQKVPSSDVDGKKIAYRYWARPSLLETATETGTSWFPEGFDRTVLVNLATFKVLHYRNNPEAGIYWQKVYGDPQKRMEGSLNKMKRAYRSPILTHIRVTAYF